MEIEQEARQLGWVPQEEFRGDLDKWVDAETFVERGKNVMPILRENNRRLEKTVQEQANEMKKLREAVESSKDAIAALQEVHAEDVARKVQDARKNLLEEIKKAKVEGDIDREVDLTDELTRLNNAQEKSESKKEMKQQEQVIPEYDPNNLDPELKKWMDKNPWFGKDVRKTQKAMGLAQLIRAADENDELTGTAFYDKLDSELNGSGSRQTSKVEGSSMGGSGSGSKSYSDMPLDAREACDKQGKRVVGEGKAFKTMSDWRKYYTELYYKEV